MIKIDLVKIAEKLYSSKQRSADNASVYVRKIADEADELATIWEEIVRSIQRGSKIDREKLIAHGAHKYTPINGASYTRLQEFYRNASTALASNDATRWVDDIAWYIGSILVDRDKANETLLAAIKNSESCFFFNEDNSEEALADLAASINVIRREASALHVLALHMEAQ